jgi:N,N'-diacetyllegionaminate synthase
MTKIIAEIGWNHMGDLDLAKKMIVAASENGSDFVKTQFFSTKNLKPGPWDNDGRRDIYEKAQLTIEKYLALKEFSSKKNIKFFTSVFTLEDLKKISEYEKDYIKVPSAEANNIDLINFASENFNNVLISTGTLKQSEIQKISDIVLKDKLTLLHCVSSYPCKDEDINLPKINHLKKYSNSVGFSDHTQGIIATILSIPYKLTYIEKHFTIDQSLPGRDNKFAILPEDLFELKKSILLFEKANIDHGENYLKCEEEVRNVYARRWG